MASTEYWESGLHSQLCRWWVVWPSPPSLYLSFPIDTMGIIFHSYRLLFNGRFLLVFENLNAQNQKYFDSAMYIWCRMGAVVQTPHATILLYRLSCRTRLNFPWCIAAMHLPGCMTSPTKSNITTLKLMIKLQEVASLHWSNSQLILRHCEVIICQIPRWFKIYLLHMVSGVQ